MTQGAGRGDDADRRRSATVAEFHFATMFQPGDIQLCQQSHHAARAHVIRGFSRRGPQAAPAAHVAVGAQFTRAERIRTVSSIATLRLAPCAAAIRRAPASMSMRRRRWWIDVTRHARPCAGHPLRPAAKQDVDGRDKPGHNELITRQTMPRPRLAILDDYQHVALKMADWSGIAKPLRDRCHRPPAGGAGRSGARARAL